MPTVDTDGNGHADVVVGAVDSTLTLLHNSGGGAVGAMTADPPSAVAGSAGGDSAPALVDLNGDGMPICSSATATVASATCPTRGRRTRRRMTTTTARPRLLRRTPRRRPRVRRGGAARRRRSRGADDGGPRRRWRPRRHHRLARRHALLLGECGLADGSGVRGGRRCGESGGRHSPSAFSHPARWDTDGDGDYDLVVGAADGQLHYFENVGTPAVPEYTPRDSLPDGLDGHFDGETVRLHCWIGVPKT